MTVVAPDDQRRMRMTTQPVSLTPEIRSARSDDLPAIERLLLDNRLPLDGVREALADFVVARAGNALIGVAGLEVCGDNALLRSVAVAAEWRSHGVGRALVTRIISEAEARGIRALYLLTTTAEHYFPSFDFTTVSRDAVPEDIRATAEFQGACPASAVVMRRSLSA